MAYYFETKDMKGFSNLDDDSSKDSDTFFKNYKSSGTPGKLTEREKALIGLVVAATQHNSNCIIAYTNKCFTLGITEPEIMEAVNTGAAMLAGITLTHSFEIGKIIKNKSR